MRFQAVARTVMAMRGGAAAAAGGNNDKQSTNEEERYEYEDDDYDGQVPTTSGGNGGGRMLTNEFLRNDSWTQSRMNVMSIRRHKHDGLVSGPPSNHSSDLTSAYFNGRLEEVLVFELTKEGERNYLHLTVRGLYKHVLSCITQPLKVSEVQQLATKDQGCDNAWAKKFTKFGELASKKTADDANTNNNNNNNNDNNTNDDDDDEYSDNDTPPGFPTTVPEDKPLLKPPALQQDPPMASEDCTKAQEKNSSVPLSVNLKTYVKKSSKLSDLKNTMEKEGKPTRELDAEKDDGNNDNNAKNANVSKRERLGGYLHPRDMRRLVTPFSASNEPDVIVRRHVMLLNFDPLRAIILRDRLLILVPTGADSLLHALEKRVRGGAEEVAKSFLGRGSSFSSDTPGNNNNNNNNDDDSSENRKSAIKVLKGKLTLKNRDSNFHSNSQHGSGSATPQSLVQSSHKRSESNTSATSSSSLFDDGGEWDDIKAQGDMDLPFELQCVDAVLYMVTSILSEDTYKMEEAALRYIQEQESGRKSTKKGQFGSKDPLKIIRHIKDALSEMTSRVNGFVQSMNRILDDDEDMALMNLTRLLTHPDRFIKPVDSDVLNEETDEPELMLEAHLQVALTLENTLRLVQGQLDTASEHIGQKLDAMRNRILFANMIISVFSLCVGTASLVGSIFGMNVTNNLEDSDHAFKFITSFTLIGVFFLGAAIMLGLVLSGTMPTTGFSDE